TARRLVGARRPGPDQARHHRRRRGDHRHLGRPAAACRGGAGRRRAARRAGRGRRAQRGRTRGRRDRGRAERLRRGPAHPPARGGGEAGGAARAAEPTGRMAVPGGEEAPVLAAIADAGLTPANINGAGQIVAGGTKAALEAFAANPPQGARLRPLRVAGAFHTSHMAPAVEALSQAAVGTVIKDPAITLLSNADGGVVTSGSNWVERIIAQVATPVRWDLCMETMSDIGVVALIELPPGGTLTGMAKRALPGIELLALKTPDQLDAARGLIAAHAASTNGYAAAPVGTPAEWRIVVAPAGRTL